MSAKVFVPAVIAGQAVLSGVSCEVSSRWQTKPEKFPGERAARGDKPNILNSEGQVSPNERK